MKSYIRNDSYVNRNPVASPSTLQELRKFLTFQNISGDAFLDYLLQGDYFDGKGVWVNTNATTSSIYSSIMDANPHLEAESPYGSFFDRNGVRAPGDNPIYVTEFSNAPTEYKSEYWQYQADLDSGRSLPRVVFAGGPAAKIASLLTIVKGRALAEHEVCFLFDGAEQSNESASASYEHVNHANALNAEHDNTGLAIFGSAVHRAVFSERDPEVALDLDYKKVDLWPTGVHWRDLSLYAANEIHGRVQMVRSLFGRINDHDKSRLASKYSTAVLTLLESDLDVQLRMEKCPARAFFLYLSEIEHVNSYREQKILSRFAGVFPWKASAERINQFYGGANLECIYSADIFEENGCIRHGFDKICSNAMITHGATVLSRTRIEEIYLQAGGPPGVTQRCVGLKYQDLLTKDRHFVPLSHVGLSLGPTATYEYSCATNLWDKWCDLFRIRQPVPHQTIATGFSAQLLCKIVGSAKQFRHLPHTGVKQTHFVEIGREGSYVLIKLTAGGNIGLPVYSRSYGISALANFFRVWPPGCGLEFVDVVCAWPGVRGINATNNGQVVRLADNAAARFGEGGTGMSKMGSNAQTLLDAIGVQHGLCGEAELPRSLYAHTVIDNRRLIRRRLAKQRRS